MPVEDDGWNEVHGTASVELRLAGSPMSEHRPELVVVVGPAMAAIPRVADETGHHVVVLTGGGRRCRAGAAAVTVVPAERAGLEA